MAWWKKRNGENNVGKAWVSVRVRMRPNEVKYIGVLSTFSFIEAS